MPLLTKTLSNIFNGVSQQPPSLRLDSQVEIQENTVSSLTEGLKKRPPTVHIGKLQATNLVAVGGAYHHLINRDPTSQYIVQIANGDLKVFDLSGVEKTVIFPSGKAYLASSTPEDDFTCLTIADYTFVVNKKTTVTESVTPGVLTKDSLVYVRAGNYQTDYQIIINGTRVAEKYTSASSIADIATSNIAEYLRKWMKVGITGSYYADTDDDPNTPPILTGSSGIATLTKISGGSGYTTATVDFTPGGGTGATGTCNIVGNAITSITINTAGTGYTNDFVPTITGDGTGAIYHAFLPTSAPSLDATWTVTRSGSTLLIQKAAGVDYTIKTTDSQGDTSIKLVKGSVQNFTDLPTVAPKDYVARVRAGTDASGDWYVKFVPLTSTDTFGQGTWIETSFDTKFPVATTMPWALVDNGNGTFTFNTATWTTAAADGNSPSFIGRKINDVIFFKNRLGLIAGENIVLSEAGKFFNFYRTTARTILDSDPIDVASSSNVVATLKHGIPFNDQLILFADQVQFSMSGGDILTPKTASIAQTTAYESTLNAKPVVVGKNIYFTVTKGGYVGVREYFVNRLTTNYDTTDTTANVPKYIPGVIKKLSKSGTEDILVGIADGDRTKLYVYKFYWNVDEKLQSSWSSFNWAETGTFSLLFAEFINSILYLVIQRADGVYLEKMNMSNGFTDSSYTDSYIYD